jgi:dienelactone hydrolase
LRFDIALLSERLLGTTDWVLQNPATKNLNIGYFGASTGAAAALSAASKRSDKIGAVVSRGGRPDLAEQALPSVEAPTLLIVGGKDYQVIDMNREALKILNCKKELQIIPGATHLFEEQGALEEVAKIAGNWFLEYLITD